MKAPLFPVGMAMLMIAGASCKATYTVRERPADVVYVRPVTPSSNHVWISGNWVWRGGRYVMRKAIGKAPEEDGFGVRGIGSKSKLL